MADYKPEHVCLREYFETLAEMEERGEVPPGTIASLKEEGSKAMESSLKGRTGELIMPVQDAA